MPNRNGMTTLHGMWPGKEFGGTGKPDVLPPATLCMKDCVTEPKVASLLPEFARNAHGNLVDQNRIIGPQRGADTTQPERKAGAPAPVASAAAPAAANAAEPAAGTKAALSAIQKNNCTACHAIDKKMVGPGFQEIGKKHAGKADYLVGKIKSGGSGVWGPVPMPPQTLNDADAKVIAAWIAQGAPK